MAERRRPPAVIFLLPLIIGLMGLSRVMSRPEFESYRTIDVVQLLVSGACIGVAVAGSIAIFVRSRFR